MSAPTTRTRWIIYACRTCPYWRMVASTRRAAGAQPGHAGNAIICAAMAGAALVRSLLPAPGAGRCCTSCRPPAAHRRGAGADPRHLLPLGIWATRHHPDRLPDYVRTADCPAPRGVSMPNFWLAFLLVMLFPCICGGSPAMGYGDWQHLIFARRLHRLYVYHGDQRPLLRASMDARRQPTSRDMGAAAVNCRARWSMTSCNATLPIGDRHGHAHWQADRRHHDLSKNIFARRGQPLRSFAFSIAITR